MLCLRHICPAALILAFFAFGVRVGTARAQGAPVANAIPVRHEICGARFAYQAGEDDTSDSLAARFGEPELTLFPDGSEPDRETRSRSIIAMWRALRSSKAS